MAIDRESLENLLRQGLAEIEAGRGGELAAARAEARKWKDEWQGLLVVLEDARTSRRWAEDSYFVVREKMLAMGQRVSELERENRDLRELLQADSVQIALMGRQIERLAKTMQEDE